jgi:fatty acid desaturase
MTQYLGDVPLYGRSHYVHAVKPELPAGVFARAASRLAWIPVHAAVIALAIVALRWVPWFVAPLLSLVIGASFAGLTFVGHELMHGAIVHGRKRKRVLGFMTFLPFTLSPKLWAHWHNKVHHATTNTPDDPDCYPTLERYRAVRAARFSVDMFSLGGSRWRGLLSLALGFTVQSTSQLIQLRSRAAFAETALGVAVWGVVAWLVGPMFVFAYILPLLVANAIVMAFIITNHSLSPRVPIDDPLVTGLSVTLPRALDWLTLNFGYHVEHHLFPAVSARHAPAIRDALVAHWPERYKSMPLDEAIARLHHTARVYADATTLIDPTTGQTFPTLMPGRCPTAVEPVRHEPVLLLPQAA